jgi:hypothetical protein
LTQIVEVGAGGTQEVVLRAYRSLFVRGTVVAPDGSRTSHAFITANDDDSDWLTSCNMDKDGTFTLGPLGPGPIQLVAQDMQLYAPSEAVRAEPGQKDVVLRLRAGGRIRGTVVDSRTGAACLADMTLTREDEKEDPGAGWISSATKEDGTFENPGLAPGRYFICARTRDGQFGWLPVEVTTDKEPEARVIHVAPGGRLRLRYEGAKPKVHVTITVQGAAVGMFEPIKQGALAERAVPAGALTLRVYRDFPGKPHTREVVLTPGETMELVLRDEE